MALRLTGSAPLPKQGGPGVPPYFRFEKASATMLRAAASLMSVGKKDDAAAVNAATLSPARKSARAAGKVGEHPSVASHSVHLRPSP